MSQENKVCYAFYRESSPSFAGEGTYAGISNGMERSFFGQGPQALDSCRKMMAGARKNNRVFQVLKYTYGLDGEARVSEVSSHGVFNPKKANQKRNG